MFKYNSISRTRISKIAFLSVIAIGISVSNADAQRRTLPNIEINLEVLQSLKAEYDYRKQQQLFAQEPVVRQAKEEQKVAAPQPITEVKEYKVAPTKPSVRVLPTDIYAAKPKAEPKPEKKESGSFFDFLFSDDEKEEQEEKVAAKPAKEETNIAPSKPQKLTEAPKKEVVEKVAAKQSPKPTLSPKPVTVEIKSKTELKETVKTVENKPAPAKEASDFFNRLFSLDSSEKETVKVKRPSDDTPYPTLSEVPELPKPSPKTVVKPAPKALVAAKKKAPEAKPAPAEVEKVAKPKAQPKPPITILGDVPKASFKAPIIKVKSKPQDSTKTKPLKPVALPRTAEKQVVKKSPVDVEPMKDVTLVPMPKKELGNIKPVSKPRLPVPVALPDVGFDDELPVIAPPESVSVEKPKKEGGFFSLLFGNRDASPKPAPIAQPIPKVTREPVAEPVKTVDDIGNDEKPDIELPKAVKVEPTKPKVKEIAVKKEEPKLAPLPDLPPLPLVVKDDPLPDLPPLTPLIGNKPGVSEEEIARQTKVVSDELPPLELPPTLEEDLPAVTALTEKPLPEAPFEVAALPSKAEPIKKEPAKEGNIPNTQIIFGETDTEIPPAMESNLGGIAKQLVDNPRSTVSVIAYASGGKGQASNARRISLSRALAVRAYLIDQGANSLQINVQAMGNKTKGQIERADIFLKNVN